MVAVLAGCRKALVSIGRADSLLCSTNGHRNCSSTFVESSLEKCEVQNGQFVLQESFKKAPLSPFQFEALLQGNYPAKSEPVGRLETENETSVDHI